VLINAIKELIVIKRINALQALKLLAQTRHTSSEIQYTPQDNRTLLL